MAQWPTHTAGAASIMRGSESRGGRIFHHFPSQTGFDIPFPNRAKTPPTDHTTPNLHPQHPKTEMPQRRPSACRCTPALLLLLAAVAMLLSILTRPAQGKAGRVTASDDVGRPRSFRSIDRQSQSKPGADPNPLNACIPIIPHNHSLHVPCPLQRRPQDRHGRQGSVS